MRKLLLLLLLPCVLLAQRDVDCATADACWGVLAAGNGHWAKKPPKLLRPNQTQAWRDELKPGRKQKPFAAIVSCSDSRVPPELIFDRGIGDLFIVRVAGNVVDPFALGSIQYAVAALNVKLVVVLGHQDCGAVQAAFVDDPKRPDFLAALVGAIVPAKQWAQDHWHEATPDNTIDANVYLTIPKIEAAIKAAGASATVLGKRYSLDGKVIDLRAK